MAKARAKLPKKRLIVTLDDAIYIDANRVWIDFHTAHGDLLLAINPNELSAVMGEIANSIRVNPREQKPKLREVANG